MSYLSGVLVMFYVMFSFHRVGIHINSNTDMDIVEVERPSELICRSKCVLHKQPGPVA